MKKRTTKERQRYRGKSVMLRYIVIAHQKAGKKNGAPDQGTPSNSHATTTSVPAPQRLNPSSGDH
jgi:hypothetical protein